MIASCAERITGGALLFDAVSRGLSERSQDGKLQAGGSYQAPPWFWGIDRKERRWIRQVPNVADLRLLRLPRGRGPVFGYVLPLLNRVPGLGSPFFSIMLARLRGPRVA